MHRPQRTISFGPGPGLPSGIRWLLVANVGVFLLQSLLSLTGNELDFVGLFGLIPPLTPAPGVSFKIWQPVTYLFLHSTSNIFHIGFNMLMLWMFGTPLERQWGRRAFLRYYFVCGIGAAVMTCLLALPMPAFRAPTIGASGAIFGLLLAYGVLWPNNLLLIWGIFPMRARTMVLVFGGLELYSLVFGGSGNIAYAAHVGGMLVGYLYLKRAWRVRSFLSGLRWRVRRRRFRVMEDRRDDDFPFH